MTKPTQTTPLLQQYNVVCRNILVTDDQEVLKSVLRLFMEARNTIDNMLRHCLAHPSDKDEVAQRVERDARDLLNKLKEASS